MSQRPNAALTGLIAAGVVAALVVVVLLRRPASEPPPPPVAFERAMAVVFLGDTGQGDQAQDFVKRRGLRASFEHARATLGDADFVIANGETPIVDASLPPIAGKNRFLPRQVPAVARAYAEEGFAAFGLANNHALDFGTDGLAQTQRHLDAVGIRTFGAGSDAEAARAPLILEQGKLAVAVLAYFEDRESYRKLDWYAGPNQPGVARLTQANIAQDVARARSRAEVVVVYPHFGKNYRTVTKDQRRLARAAVQAGAHLVVGHGAHMAQLVEMINGVPVLYSVGNFIWHSRGLFADKGVEHRAYALVTRVELDHERIRRIRLTPLHVNNQVVEFVPQRVAAERARELFDEILMPLQGRWRLAGSSAVIELP